LTEDLSEFTLCICLHVLEMAGWFFNGPMRTNEAAIEWMNAGKIMESILWKDIR
jgi:hypothetical protein